MPVRCATQPVPTALPVATRPFPRHRVVVNTRPQCLGQLSVPATADCPKTCRVPPRAHCVFVSSIKTAMSSCKKFPCGWVAAVKHFAAGDVRTVLRKRRRWPAWALPVAQPRASRRVCRATEPALPAQPRGSLPPSAQVRGPMNVLPPPAPPERTSALGTAQATWRSKPVDLAARRALPMPAQRLHATA